MNPAGIDFTDVGDKTMSLICRKLLKAGNCRENPAYRLNRVAHIEEPPQSVPAAIQEMAGSCALIGICKPSRHGGRRAVNREAPENLGRNLGAKLGVRGAKIGVCQGSKGSRISMI
jgi:hypothetical protein